MTAQQASATWVFYTLSRLRRFLGLDWLQFNELVLKHGLIAFLFDNYELLHYYGMQYIIDDILDYMSKQGSDSAISTA